ncbi:MAG: 3'-5' exonuclease, partial [Thermoanaerobaculia bacterium]
LQLVAPASAVRGRPLAAVAEGPDLVEVHRCASERAEAELVVATIERLVGGSSFFSIDSGRGDGSAGGTLSFADFAVLYRTEAQAAPLVEALARSGIPFQKRSHLRLADLPWVEELLRSLEASRDRLAGGGSLADLLAAHLPAAAEGDPSAEPHRRALRALAERCGGDLPRFISELSLGVDADLLDPRAERVSLLTLHASKGLEYPVVFIAGCEDGLLPLRFGSGEGADLDEERRLFFVGMTRARSRLFLTWARRRALRGQPKSMEPSPFLRDVEERLLSLRSHQAPPRPPSPFRQLTLFD